MTSETAPWQARRPLLRRQAPPGSCIFMDKKPLFLVHEYTVRGSNSYQPTLDVEVTMGYPILLANDLQDWVL
jgi:hypothetical protein